MKYELWCSYCGKTLSIKVNQGEELPIDKYVCDVCSTILDWYVEEDESDVK